MLEKSSCGRAFLGFMILFPVFVATPSYAQSSTLRLPKPGELYVACSLVDDPHKTVYYSAVFLAPEAKIHLYEKAFSTHLEMTNNKVIGTAKCSGYKQEAAAKVAQASLQENWHWVYKTSVPTGWTYVSSSMSGNP